MTSPSAPVLLSIGIMAWNEEESIVPTLASLFRQSVFARVATRGERVEIVVLANGCTDRTVEVARAALAEAERTTEWPGSFAARVEEIAQPGRNHAWNRFVHAFSAREARFVALMDADILFRHPETLFRLVETLEQHPQAGASAGRQDKDLQLKPHPTLWERLSLATSAMTGTIPGQISGQLYCLRASVARNIHFPRDLGAPDDGFLKAVITTEFFSRPADAGRIRRAPDAAHVFEAYVSLRDILANQQRQMMGQTSVHILVDYLQSLPEAQRRNLGATLRRLDERDPDWLRRRIAEHLQARPFCWQLFPGLLTFRFVRCWRLGGWRRLTHLPAACAGFVVTLIAAARARRALVEGGQAFWPKATRRTILALAPGK